MAVSPPACHLRCDDLSSDMCLQGLAVQSLHGGRDQCDREEALKDFKDSTSLEGNVALENKLSISPKTETEIFGG